MFDAEGKLPIKVELKYDGVWNDITCDSVNAQDNIVISRGRQDEAGQVDPSTCTLTLNNTDGRYTPRNPRSPLYGKIGRNTPIRVRIVTDQVGLSMPGIDGAYARTPDVSALDIAGDLDVRLELTPTTWRPASFMPLVTKQQPTSGNTSWSIHLLPSGALELSWSTDGTNGANRVVKVSTAAIPSATERLAVRATLDVDNGASGNTVTFYTAPGIAGPWAQLGSAVVTAGVTSVFLGAAGVAMGAADNGSLTFANASRFSGLVHAFELRDGINGTAVADPVFDDQEPGVREFTDAAGRVWSVLGSAQIINMGIRFRGEVTEWPKRWDSPEYAWVPITAKGVKRRLGQGDAPLSSAMYRGLLGASQPQPKAYWPCEEGDTATFLASALDGGSPMAIAGEVDLAAYSDFDSSLPIPTLKVGSMSGAIAPYEPYTPNGTTTYIRAMALAHVPGEGVANATVLMSLTTTGSASHWYLYVTPAGDLRILCYDNTADVAGARTAIVDDTYAFDVNGRQVALGLYLVRSGANIDWQIFVYRLGSSAMVGQGTLTNRTLGRATSINIGGMGPLFPFATGLNGTAIGHVVVLDTDEFWDMLDFIRAWNFELALDRVIRLCAEQGVQLTAYGGTQDTPAVGPQKPSAFLDLLQSATDVDMGILYEPLNGPGLAYRTRRNMYNQPAKLTLDYAAGHVVAPFEPTDDDQAVRNDVTVARERGTSARVVQTSGPMSVLDPPDGVGRYDESVTLDIGHDTQVASQAGWRVHLGTVDEDRYPQIRVDLSQAGSPELAEQVIQLDLGDRLVIQNPPEWLPPGVIEQLIQGWEEQLNTLTWDITFNCTPASPWNIGRVADETYGKADTSGSALVSAITDTATSFQVATTQGPRWTTDAGQMPIDVTIGGEVMRVTAITGTSPQTFTVTRGINGFTKAHAASSGVRLAHPAVVAL